MATIPAEAPRKALDYRPQLDGLRALAVTSVLLKHFLSPLAPGMLGVRLFFVLSGFLITSILLQMKEQDAPLGHNLKTFYARRLLRIWPIYYLTLGAAWLAGAGNIDRTIWWHLAHLSNIYYIVQERWYPAISSHLWSLSIEEQFYLVWPFIVLLVPERRLIAITVAAIAIAFVSRMVVLWLNMSAEFAFVLATPSAFDALGLGALMAVLKGRGASLEPFRRLIGPAFIAALAGWVAQAFGVPLWIAANISLLAFSVAFAGLVAGALTGFGGAVGKILEFAPLVYLGKISYGVYLYHLFVAAAVFHLLDLAGVRMGREGPVAFLVLSAATFLVASVSWFAIERPANSLKRFFPYPPRRDAAHEASGPAARSDA